MRMEVTIDMLQAAMKKAIEAGLLPRNSTVAERENSMEIMHAIVEAALDAMPDENAAPLLLRPPGHAAEHRSAKNR